jgi:hypothetical protein
MMLQYRTQCTLMAAATQLLLALLLLLLLLHPAVLQLTSARCCSSV